MTELTINKVKFAVDLPVQEQKRSATGHALASAGSYTKIKLSADANFKVALMWTHDTAYSFLKEHKTSAGASRRIGRGTYGMCYATHARSRSGKVEWVCTKLIDMRGKAHAAEQCQKATRFAVSMMKKYAPDLLIALLQGKSAWYVIMPLAAGTVRNYLDPLRALSVPKQPNMQLARHAVSVILGVARTLVSMHSDNVVHDDIKLANLLILDGRVRLTDFDLAQTPPFGTKSGRIKEDAPERVMRTDEFEKLGFFLQGTDWLKSDVYALALCILSMYEIVFEKDPYMENARYYEAIEKERCTIGRPHAKISHLGFHETWKRISTEMPQPLADLITSAMALSPKRRMSIVEMMTKAKDIFPDLAVDGFHPHLWRAPESLSKRMASVQEEFNEVDSNPVIQALTTLHTGSQASPPASNPMIGEVTQPCADPQISALPVAAVPADMEPPPDPESPYSPPGAPGGILSWCGLGVLKWRMLGGASAAPPPLPASIVQQLAIAPPMAVLAAQELPAPSLQPMVTSPAKAQREALEKEAADYATLYHQIETLKQITADSQAQLDEASKKLAQDTEDVAAGTESVRLAHAQLDEARKKLAQDTEDVAARTESVRLSRESLVPYEKDLEDRLANAAAKKARLEQITLEMRPKREHLKRVHRLRRQIYATEDYLAMRAVELIAYEGSLEGIRGTTVAAFDAPRILEE